jgi:hypothetical protein
LLILSSKEGIKKKKLVSKPIFSLDYNLGTAQRSSRGRDPKRESTQKTQPESLTSEF